MAGTTNNRRYPFPGQLDADNVPADIQRLAEAVDTDVAAIKKTSDATKAATDGLGFAYFESGSKNISPTGSHAYTYLISFRRTYSSPPSVVVSRADPLPGGSAPWAFAAAKITTTGFQLIAYTVDGSRDAPSASITAAWQAFGR